MRSLEQKKVVKHSVVLSASVVTVADVEDDRDGDGSSASQWGCLGACRDGGDREGEVTRRGDDWSDEGERCAVRASGRVQARDGHDGRRGRGPAWAIWCTTWSAKGTGKLLGVRAAL